MQSFTPKTQIPRAIPGQAVTAEMFNELIDAVNSLLNLQVSPPLSLERTAGGLVVALAISNRWEVVELTSSLSAGGTATAKMQVYNGSSWEDSTNEEITISDVIGSMSGDSGNKAIVGHHPHDVWVVWQIFC